MKRKLITLLLVLTLALSLMACNKTEDPGTTSNTGTQSDQGTSSDSGSSSGPVEISVARSLAPSSLEPADEDNPMATTATFMIFDRLVAFDYQNNDWYPQVASAWRQIDAVTWEFDIILDITFHNGDKLTMDDVVYSIERLKDFPRTMDKWELIDTLSYNGNTLTIKFANAFGNSPSKVLAVAFIVNKAYIEAGGEDAIFMNPVGTGPFKATAFTPLSSVTLEAFDNYYYGRHGIDKINFHGMPQTDARYIALESGQIQYAGDLDMISYTMAGSDAGLIQAGFPSKTITGVAFNMARQPFDDVNVRRALIHALDIPAFCSINSDTESKSLLYGGYLDMYYEGPNYPEYNLDKAKELFEAAGISASNPLNFEVLCVVPYPGAEIWQTALMSLGVNMTITQPEFGVYLSREISGDFDVIISGFGNRGNHPLTDLDRFSKDMIGTLNFTKYINDDVQALIDKIRVETDEAQQLALSRQLEDILSQEIPMIGLFCNLSKAAAYKGLTGITINGWGTSDLRTAVYSG